MEHSSHRPEGNVIAVSNETESKTTRTTKEGKPITYQLKVLQQPQRARACGAGAKSSADRRPVDPPPIVELKIFDGEHTTDPDITFNMNANYFLFATLEQARPMAHGRVGEDKTTRLTVLTGTPVAGMVYLDRPAPAGYFIFPDLSVRHEGKYRLSFSLYEELKDAKDDDRSASTPRASSPSGGDAHVTHRLEVKSQPFTVFSAKKFPGLTESTALSRMVAEQGCRVRIRRDVRMRRRDTKSGKEWDDYDEETAPARARVSSTPDPHSAYPTLPPPMGYSDASGRPRSSSNASHQSLLNPLSRRPSLQELNQGYQQPYSAGPQTPQAGYSQTSPYGPSPNQQYSQPPFMHQPPTMPPPPSQYQSQTAYQPQQPVSAPVPAQQGYYGYAPAPAPASAPSHGQYPPSPAYDGGVQPQRMSMDYSSQLQSDQRRASTQYSAPPPPPAQGPYTPQHAAPSYAAQNGYQAPPPPPPPQQPMYPSHDQRYGPPDHFASRAPPLQDAYLNRAPPPQPVQPPARASGATTPLSARSSFDHRMPSSLPPLHVPSGLGDKLEPSPVNTPDTYWSAASDSRKRNHGAVFREPHQYQAMRQGARPSDSYSASGPVYSGSNGVYAPDDADDGEADILPSGRRMQYHRADGRLIQRSLPAHSDE